MTPLPRHRRWIPGAALAVVAALGSAVPAGAVAATPEVGQTGNAAGALNQETDPEVDQPEVFIHDVQGSGPSVAITTEVTVQAIATSLFERRDVLDGFFIQEEDADADADPATSEGLFVFCRGGCPAVEPGDLVSVTGTGTDFFGMSQIDATGGTIEVESSGHPLPSSVPVDLPADGRTDAEATFEHLEGMVVEFSDTLVVSEYFQLARYGQLVLTADARPEQFTDANSPDVAGYAAFQDDLATRRIILDDNNNDQNDSTGAPVLDEPYPYPGAGLSIDNTFRGGDTIDGLTGVLHWSFAGQTGTDAWRIRQVPTEDYTFAPTNPQPLTPPAVAGDMTVASFNVLNYFVTLDVGANTCGPSGLSCRGANSAAELERQRAKIVSALAAIDADVFGLIEIENDEGAATQDLVDALNAATAPGTYDYIDTGFIGGDAIKVALIHKPATVEPVGPFAVLDSSIDPAFIDTKNRPALIQTFATVTSGERFTVAVNHLKSKGSPCDDLGDPDLGDGQANCNQTRTAAATALATYLASDPTGSGDADTLIIGDLNAYAMEDPISALHSAGYTDLVAHFGGPDAYSYVFDGQVGYLDYALANGDLQPQVAGTAVWHINADEVGLLDYNDDIRDDNERSFEEESAALPLYAPDPFRSSDHDPVIIGLDLGAGRLSCGDLSGSADDLELAGYNVIVGDGTDRVLLGGDGRDLIIGSEQAEVILGGGDDDVICGGGGNDVVLGGLGADTVFGQDGDDYLSGNLGSDSLHGGAGDDVIHGGGGDDALNGGEGDDRLWGDPGADTCDGGPHDQGDRANQSCETTTNVP